MRMRRGGGSRTGSAVTLGAAVLLPAALPFLAPPARAAEPGNAETVAWFRATEQALMDAVAAGDRVSWDRVLDPTFVTTSEEGEVTARDAFLAALRGLPPGLEGSIAVRELTVQELPGVAIVRYLADEKESVFGQHLATRYRVTDVFRRDSGNAAVPWKMVASHASVVTADPPAQKVSSAAWPSFVGAYKLLPDGWTFTVELRDGKLFGGRDAQRMRELIPLTSHAFVQQGGLGEWIFATDERGAVTHLLDFRKFEPLIWTRVANP